MGIKTKFYLYLLVTIALSPILASEMVLAYQSPNALDIILVLLILSVYLGLYLAIRKDFLLITILTKVHALTMNKKPPFSQ